MRLPAEKISIDVVYSLRDASDTKIADLTTIRGMIPLRFRTPNNIAQRKGANEKEATLAGRLQLLKKRLTSRYPECNIPDPGAFNAGLVEDQFLPADFRFVPTATVVPVMLYGYGSAPRAH